ncbi:MAG: hypothetical protein MUC69_02760 [Gemmatimonadales bacterium]|jgi:hypothetical protein|nr:hypothetical protein [Gemmatimonadales bacterium]
MHARPRDRYVLLVLLGVVGLLAKRWLGTYLGDIALSYAGNLSASFAVYFIIAIAASSRMARVATAAVALLVVAGFECTDGFGVMTNVHDPWDHLANALGIALAAGADAGLARLLEARGGHA